MTVVTGWDLFEDMRDAQDELLRFNRLRSQGLAQFGQYYGGGIAKAAWAPALDITERKDAYLVTVELPGVGIDDLEITFQDGLLTIQGERHDAHHSSEEMVHRVERRYGRFLRSITLPTHVMADAIEASWCPRRRRYRPNVSRSTPARNTPARHQPSKAKPATDGATTQATYVSRRHRRTKPWRRET
jgi:HSP20 family protein